jgi:predicted transcriptional regulator of viral defense system
MTQLKTPIIWKRLIIENKRFTTTKELHELAWALSKPGDRSLRYLQEHHYIYRVFRGIFYVKNPVERERGIFQLSIFEILAMALTFKGIENWYFALETALKLNEMTHEYFTINFVVTDSFRTTKVINIIDTEFIFLKWSKDRFKNGIIKKDSIRYSDQEKTAIDLTYKKYLEDKKAPLEFSPILEFKSRLDLKKLNKYLDFYPSKFASLVRGQL